ncbi:MAG: GGDEF domain-containing protein [Pseudomonadota bacterium]
MPSHTFSREFVRYILCILLLGLTTAGSALAASKPAALEHIDAAIWDDPQRALHDAAEVLDRKVPRPDDAALLAAALKMAMAGETLEQTDAAKRGLDLGMSLAQSLHDDAAVCVFRGTEAYVARQTGERQEATVRRYAEAIAFATAAGMDWCVARLQLQQGRMYSFNHRGAEASKAMIEAQRLFEVQNDRAWMASTLSDLCWIYHREEDNPVSLQRAIDNCEAALAMVDPEHQRYLAATVHHNLAGAYLVSHVLQRAREHVERAYEFANAIGDGAGMGYISRLHAGIEIEAKKPERALALLDRSQTAFRRYALQGMLLEVSLLKVQVLTTLRRHVEAQQELDATEPMRRKADSASTDVDYHRSALGLFRALGDHEKALRASMALDAAHQRLARENNRKAANELQERFEVQRKDAENRLLREQQRSADSQRWLLLVSLVLSVTLLGVAAAYLLQQQRLRRHFARLASRDDLTGMPNRRSILETARQVNSDRRRSHEAACIAILDIDHFKVVNDTYGHDIGDAALITFGRVCGDKMRGRDVLGRYGGEEFMLVLPGARVADLPAVFDRLRSGLRAEAVPGMPPDARLTFSMGCTQLQAGEEIEEAIKRADEGLYRAKREGRDRLAIVDVP